jgi:hypothetical protein
VCIGYMTGWLEIVPSFIILGADGKAYSNDLEEHVTIGQMTRVFVTYMDLHPDEREQTSSRSFDERHDQHKTADDTAIRPDKVKKGGASEMSTPPLASGTRPRAEFQSTATRSSRLTSNETQAEAEPTAVASAVTSAVTQSASMVGDLSAGTGEPARGSTSVHETLARWQVGRLGRPAPLRGDNCARPIAQSEIYLWPRRTR